jgi:hypothetical protein
VTPVCIRAIPGPEFPGDVMVESAHGNAESISWSHVIGSLKIRLWSDRFLFVHDRG